MYVRENKQKNRRLKEKRRRRRRRRKKLLRAGLLFIIILVLLLAMGGILILGKSLYERATGARMKIPWSFGTVDIMLDAGHGGKDQGASSETVLEKDITLAITEKTKELLEEAGYKVGMVRDDDTFVELGERAEYANRKESKVFVSIHCNSSEDGEGNGIETYYTEQKGKMSQALAQVIQDNVIERTEARDRGIKTADYIVIVRTEMPAILVEAGFLSDNSERELLQDEEYQAKLAAGISEGIKKYLEAVEDDK